jgi:hypothetical protein
VSRSLVRSSRTRACCSLTSPHDSAVACRAQRIAVIREGRVGLDERELLGVG